MMNYRWIIPYLLVLVTGCCPRPARVVNRGEYRGPTKPLAVVVDRVNRNNQQLPTLWGRFRFTADVVQDGKSRRLDGDGNLLYANPSNLAMKLTHPAAGTVLEMGVNPEQYWVIDPREDTMWWGRTPNAGKPCARAVPIRPDLIAAVLAVGAVETDLARLPAPVMRFDYERDAYVVVWVAPEYETPPARYVAQREVWYDRATLRPTQVRLYDVDGRVLVKADLSNHAKVDDTDGAVVARRLDLLLPDSGSAMTIDLTQVKLTSNGRPREGSFAMPDPSTAGARKVQQVDEECGP